MSSGLKFVVVILFLVVVLLIFGGIAVNVYENKIKSRLYPSPVTSEVVDKSKVCLLESAYYDYVRQCLSAYKNLSKISSLSTRVEGLNNIIKIQEGQITEAIEENTEFKRRILLCANYVPPVCPSNRQRIDIGCSGSMLPNFHCSWQVSVYKPNLGELKVCDVVSFSVSPEKRVFHRIVGVNGSRFITRGDANYYSDSYQSRYEDVEWKVCYE